jgi:hypothetical protein
MEGPNLLRSFPRTTLCCSVELGVGERTIRLKQARGNRSAGGVFIHTEELPLNTSVHIKIEAAPPFEADGIVRFCQAGGVGIEFTTLSPAIRHQLDQLIAESAGKENLA